MTRVIDRGDQLIALLDQGLATVLGSPGVRRPSPAGGADPATLTAAETATSAALMRVNRAGEISAQALYSGQALFASSPETRARLEQAAAEEIDHLVWCTSRLETLGGRRSLLDPAWFLGSLGLGMLAGLAGDAASLGFVAETEDQVEAHLEDHLRRLPATDAPSRAILEQMAADEAHHGTMARLAGGSAIPGPCRRIMAAGGSILRRVAFFV